MTMPGGLVALALLVLAVAAPMPVAAGDVESGRRQAEACAACHGADGNATTPGTPSLAGMPAFYTHWQLIMFRDGRRNNPQMPHFVKQLTDADLADLAAYYAAQPPRSRPAKTDPSRADAGRPLAIAHHCTSCHGPELMGKQQVPRLAGQDLDYLLNRLRGYKARTTSDLDGMMTMIAQPLTEEQVENLAHYMAALAPDAIVGDGASGR